MNKKEEAKEYHCQIETTKEIELPPEVIEALKLGSGDSIQFFLADDGHVYLEKA